jgi:hypothetical protein
MTVVTASGSSVDVILTYYEGKSSDSWFCDSQFEIRFFVMEYNYSAREKADMYFVYDRVNENSWEARRLYAEHYTQRRISSHKLFIKLLQRLSKSGSFAPRASDRGRPQFVRIPDMEVRILRGAEEDPGTSVLRIAAAESIGVSLVRRILHEESLYQCNIQLVQARTSPDQRARVVFCQWLLAKCFVNKKCVANILLTDEVGFTRDGIVNLHNARVSLHDNHHTAVAPRHRHRFSISVCLGILCNQRLRPVALPSRLTGALYHHFLANDSPVFLERVPLHHLQHM